MQFNIFAPHPKTFEVYDPIVPVIHIDLELPDGAPFDAKAAYRGLVEAAQAAYNDPNDFTPNDESPFGKAITHGINVRHAIHRELEKATDPAEYAHSERDECGWRRDGVSEQDDGIITFYEAPIDDARWMLVAMRYRMVPSETSDGGPPWQIDLEEHWIEQNRDDPTVKLTHQINITQRIDHFRYGTDAEAHAAVRLHAAVDQRYRLPEPNEALEHLFD